MAYVNTRIIQNKSTHFQMSLFNKKTSVHLVFCFRLLENYFSSSFNPFSVCGSHIRFCVLCLLTIVLKKVCSSGKHKTFKTVGNILFKKSNDWNSSGSCIIPVSLLQKSTLNIESFNKTNEGMIHILYISIIMSHVNCTMT